MSLAVEYRFLKDRYLLLLSKVRVLRSTQKAYFSTRDRQHLIASKELEKEIDEMIKEDEG